MRKEILISILVGLTLGLIITYGFYTARLSTQTANLTSKGDLENLPTPTPDGQSSTQLRITSPIDGSLVTDAKVQVDGQVMPNGFVVISLLDQIFVSTADDQGKFTQELTLKPGGNIIMVQTTDENGEVFNDSRTVILEDAATMTATGSAATPSPTPTPTPTKTNSKITPTPTAKP